MLITTLVRCLLWTCGQNTATHNRESLLVSVVKNGAKMSGVMNYNYKQSQSLTVGTEVTKLKRIGLAYTYNCIVKV